MLNHSHCCCRCCSEQLRDNVDDDADYGDGDTGYDDGDGENDTCCVTPEAMMMTLWMIS